MDPRIIHRAKVSNMLISVFNSVINRLLSPFPRVETQKSEGAKYWQDKIYYVLSVAFAYLGFIAGIFGIIASLKEKLYYLIFFIILVYSVILFLAKSKKLPFATRSRSLVSVIHAFGTFSLIFVGQYGGGFIWLFSFPIFSGILLGLRNSYIALGLNIATLLLLTIGIEFHVFSKTLLISEYIPTIWLVNISIFILFNIGVTLSLTIFLEELKKLLYHQQEVQDQLIEEHTKIAKARFDVEEHNMHISQFLANFSHELRSPMNAIIGFSSLLRTNQYDRDKQELFYSIIEEKGQYLLQLINDVIDISKIGSDQMKFVPELCALYPVFEELAVYFTEETKRMDKLDIQLNLTVREDLKSLIFVVDILRLKQIMINFLSNAIKFTEKGTIEFGYSLNGHNTVRFYVKDSGIGLSAADQDVIFKRFGQAADNNKAGKDGIGLGLFITKNLVVLMKGKIWVESEIGKGSEFIVEFPFEPVLA